VPVLGRWQQDTPAVTSAEIETGVLFDDRFLDLHAGLMISATSVAIVGVLA
jgi:hypothetical protein